jgi:hypothetical protein
MRCFPPGSEWLYAKLYTGTATADQVLRQVVRPVTETALRCGAADGWFFIRYGDPDWHLRLRLHGQPKRLQEEVWPALRAAVVPLLDNGRVWRMQLDTYEREVERYGGAEGIELAERLFQADSEAMLQMVAGHGNRSMSTLRLRTCGRRGPAWHIGGRDRVVGKSAGCDIGGNVRARWFRARFVIGGTEGIVRFCRRHRSPSFAQPRVEGASCRRATSPVVPRSDERKTHYSKAGRECPLFRQLHRRALLRPTRFRAAA